MIPQPAAGMCGNVLGEFDRRRRYVGLSIHPLRIAIMFRMKTAPASVTRNLSGFNMKTAVTLTESGSLDISDVQPGESVSLRPDPVNGVLDSVVVIDGNGIEETLSLPAMGETAYSASSQPPVEAVPIETIPVTAPR